MPFDAKIDVSLEHLNAVSGHVFVCPCTPAELVHLEESLGLPLPDGFKSLLRRIGLVQDLFYGCARTIGGMRLCARRLHDAGVPAEYFPFADDGEDSLLLCHEPSNSGVYRLSTDTGEITRERESLPQFLKRHVEEARQLKGRLANEQKVWAVQFSVTTNDEYGLVELLHAAAGIEDRGTDWVHSNTSPAGVKCCARDLVYKQQVISLKRQEHADWETPIFYLDWQQPVLELHRGSAICLLDSALVASAFDYVLVDYGLLPSLEQGR